jgi:hypothetical protein
MQNFPSLFEGMIVTDIPEATEEKNIGVDFSFFTSEEASSVPVDAAPKGKKKKNSVTVIPEEQLGINGMVNPVPGSDIAETNYHSSFSETNNLLRGAIAQADEMSAAIKGDIDEIRASKTIKGKYTYLTNLTASASSLLTTKISAIKELNSTISQAHKLNLDRFKTLKLDKSEANDDMKMMDIYSAFVNTPIGVYTPPAPSIQDITLGVNNPTAGVAGVEMVPTNGTPISSLTPEQTRMRMESNPNVQVVVRYNQATGQRAFDVIDTSTGVSIPNYPRPDAFLLEDTTIDIHTQIARNRNINQVWPLILDGNNIMNEY